MYPRLLRKERSRQLLFNGISGTPESDSITFHERNDDDGGVSKVRKERRNKATGAQAQAVVVDGAKPKSSLSDEDRLRSIAMNSREIRLVGPDGKEVEMKDDVPTKIIVAFENLQKEASEVWDQVNTKLDKGWSEFKTMVERAVKPEKKSSLDTNNYVLTSSASGSGSSSSGRLLREAPDQYSSSLNPVFLVGDANSYSFADEDMTKAAQSQAESAGSKIKAFFSDTVGINEDNTKKAGDALSKAGTAVSETMTKDLPDALKKAGDAVSDTVTKDIPEAFKNFFG